MEENSVKMDKIVIEHGEEENEVFSSTNEEEHKNNSEPVIATELECGGPGTSSDQGNIKNNNNNNNNNNINLNKNNNNKKVNNRRRKRSYRRKNNLKNPKNCFKNNTKCDKQNPRFVGRDNERKKLYFKESRRFVPYNTNEFLMEDHFPKLSPNFIYSPSFRPSISMEDSPRVYSVKSLDDTNYDYLTKEFSSDYEKIRTETLHELNKDELIEEYLKLEKQIEQSMKVKEDTIRRQNVVIFDLRRRLNTKDSKMEGVQEHSVDSDSDSCSSSSCSSSSSSSSSSGNSNCEPIIENGFEPMVNNIEPIMEMLPETVLC